MSACVDGGSMECRLKPYYFEDVVDGLAVGFYVVKMKDSLFLWIGDTGSFGSLAVAMSAAFQKVPISTPILGDFSDENSSSLAMKLCKKLGKQVFASYSMKDHGSERLLHLYSRLLAEINKNPDKF